MELYRADLHIHSRFSRATSKTLSLRQLAAWGRVKGLDVVATGDFTHSSWMAEIEEMLVPEESGLFKLKDPRGLTRELPWLSGYPLAGETRFALCTEISSIYKRGGKVRKVHNLVFMPDLTKAKDFTRRLAQVGNLESDGRPILGLDSRDLLEMVLETGEDCHLIPAHIWTPWFSLFGSKSGFDTVEECFGDLSRHIFAMETGLSSDPAMNWMLSALDRFQLVSNSDAHSGEKLGREANLFSGELSYLGMFKALRGQSLGDKFLGTIEFFPEEGKYHLDGHRKCGVVLDPQETNARGGLCPVCGKPLTVGVLNRVMELADREKPVRPTGHPDFNSLIPLKEILAEIIGVGSGSKKVEKRYAALIARFGSEFTVLQDLPPEDLAKSDRVLGEAVGRMRRGEVLRQAGYDGEYGVIRVFSEQEIREIRGGGTLISMAGAARPAPKAGAADTPLLDMEPFAPEGRVELNEAQKRAVAAGPHPVLVLAGPGTGKTRTLLGRIESLLDSGVGARRILAATFTRRAAEEMGKRLIEIRGEKEALPRADTLHALAFEYWTRAYNEAPVVLDEEAARRAFARATGLSGAELKEAWGRIEVARERMRPPEGELAEHFQAYTKLKESWNLADYTDLLVFWLEQIESGIYMNPFTHVLVDEVQDLTPLQLAVARALSPKGGEGFFAIGDPNQSIYSFRGAAGQVADDLREAWPNLEIVTLTENYRSSQLILDAAHCLTPDSPRLKAGKDISGEIRLFSAPSAQAEAAWIAERVRELVGSTSHSLMDSGEDGGLSPGEIGVLVRFKGLVEPVRKALDRFGLPVAAPEAEAFWHEPRVSRILDAAGRFLGLTGREDESGGGLDLPDSVISRGPMGMAAYLQDIAPFDRLFWKSPAFRRLSKAYDEHGGWAGLINWLNLQTEMDQVRAKAEKVQILTMHAAKGLEFEAVFMPALEAGIVPFAGADFLLGKPGSWRTGDVSEEKRLFYVALTRAKSRAYLSHAVKRRLFGKEFKLPPSEFLGLLPEDLLSRSRLVGKMSRQEKQLGLL